MEAYGFLIVVPQQVSRISVENRKLTTKNAALLDAGRRQMTKQAELVQQRSDMASKISLLREQLKDRKCGWAAEQQWNDQSISRA